MKRTAAKLVNSELFKRIYGAMCMVLIGLVLCEQTGMLGDEDSGLLLVQAAVAAVLLVYLLGLKRPVGTDEKILGVWLGWTMISRVILEDLSNGLQGTILWSVCGLCVFAAGAALTGSERKKLMNWAAGLIGGVLFFWAACGIIVVLSQYDYLPLVHKNISMYLEVKNGFHVRHLSFYNLHRNDTAPWFMIGLWLMAYQWLACEKKLWRIPIGISCLMFYVIVALQHCRSVYVATAGGAAMFAMLLLKPKQGQKEVLRRWVAACLVAVLCLAVVYKSFSVCDSVITRVSETTGRIYAQLRGWEIEEPEGTENPEEGTGDSRDLVHDLKTMTGRKSIWRGIYRTRKAEPVLLLLGQQENDVMPYLMEYGDLHYETRHTHNMFMEALAVTGLPGLLLCLAFTVLTVLRMLRMFFRKSNLAAGCLAIPLATLLVYGMMEPMLSINAWFASLCFVLLAGVLYSAETRK